MPNRLHRFLIVQALQEGQIDITDKELLHQWNHVLRFEPHGQLLLIDGKGHEADAVLKRIDRSFASVLISSVRDSTTQPKRNVTLYCGLLQRGNMELVLQKATEVGAKAIVPIITQRTVKTGLKMDRCQKIVQEAVEQCGRGFLPALSEPIPFADAVASASGMQVFFHLEGDADWAAQAGQAEEVGVWIGPEGGWTDEELAIAKEKGFLIGSLGSLVLRAETAAIVATYLTCTGA